MSYQVPVSEPSTVSVRPQRIRHDNTQSIGMSAGTKDILITGAALGVGALGGYFILDYLFRNNVIDKITEGIGITPPASGIVEEDKQADIAYTEPIFDRTTRVSSWGNTGVSAYRGRRVAPRLSSTDISEINADDVGYPGFNQLFTDHEVIEVL